MASGLLADVPNITELLDGIQSGIDSIDTPELPTSLQAGNTLINMLNSVTENVPGLPPIPNMPGLPPVPGLPSGLPKLPGLPGAGRLLILPV